MAKRMALWLVWVIFLVSGSAWAVPAHTITPDMARLSSFGSVDFTQGMAARLITPTGNGMSILHSASMRPESERSEMGLAGTRLGKTAPNAISPLLPRRNSAHIQASMAAGGGLPLLVNVDPNNPQAPRLVPAFGEPVSLTFLGIGLLTSARFLRKKRRNLGV